MGFIWLSLRKESYWASRNCYSVYYINANPRLLLFLTFCLKLTLPPRDSLTTVIEMLVIEPFLISLRGLWMLTIKEDFLVLLFPVLVGTERNLSAYISVCGNTIEDRNDSEILPCSLTYSRTSACCLVMVSSLERRLCVPLSSHLSMSPFHTFATCSESVNMFYCHEIRSLLQKCKCFEGKTLGVVSFRAVQRA